MKGAKSPLRVQSTCFSNFFKVRKTASAGRKDFFDTLKRPEAAASGRSLALSVVEEADDDKHGADHGHDRARDLQDAFDGFHISALLFFSSV